MIVLSLVGCGSGSNEADGKIVLSITVWNYEQAPEFQALFQAYEDFNPDVTFDVIDISADNYAEKLTTMLASEDTTDLLTMKNITDYSNFALRGQLVDMTEFVNSLDKEAYGDALEHLKTDEDQYFAIPYRTDFWALYYNKDLFDENGIDYPENLTWEEYRDIAKILTSGTGGDKVYGAHQHVWRSIVQGVAAAQTGGDQLGGNYEFLKDYYETILAMQAEGSIMDFGTILSSNTSYRSQFELQKTAMMPMGSWYLAELLDVDFNWGIAPLPQITKENEIITMGLPTSLAINKHSFQVEEAEKFIEYVTGEEGAKVLASIGIVPAIRNDEITNLYFNVAGMPDDDLSKRAFNPDVIESEVPLDKRTPTADQILGEEHELIMILDQSVDEGIKQMNERIAKELN